MATHFLDIEGKIADGEAILNEYYEELREAQRSGDEKEVKRLERLIETQENYLNGLRLRLKD